MSIQLSLNRLIPVVSWIILLLAGLLSVAPLVPPSPASGPDAAEFSTARAFETVESISQEPRPIGSVANQRVRAQLVSELAALGLEPEVQIVQVPNYYGGPPDIVEVGNVAARIPGTSPTTAVALVGHYDTIPNTPGANDNGSAVAILLESARAILAGDRPRNDLILLFTDGEEPAPRYGASAFVAEHPWAGDIGFVINLEALGGSGQSIISQMGGPRRWVMDNTLEAVPYPRAFSFLTTLTELIGGSNTDFSTFHAEGIPGVEFVYLTGSPIYHTPADTPEQVSWRSLYQQGTNTLALARQLGNLDFDADRDDSEAIFFNVGRRFVVQYPISWTFPIVVASGLLLLAAGWRLKRPRQILGTAGITLAIMLIAAVLSTAIWMVLARQRDAMGVAESYLYLLGLILLVAVIFIAAARLARREYGDDAAAAGVITVWWALGLPAAIAAPGMSYLFLLPALGGSLILLWRTSPEGNRTWLPVVSLLLFGVALVLLVPPVDIFYQFAQPRPGNPDSELIPMIAVPVALLSLLVALFRVLWLRPSSGPSSRQQTATQVS